MAETNQSQTGGMFDNKSGAQPAPAQQPQQNVPVVQKDVVDSVLAKITKFEETGELKLPANYSAANALKSAWLILQETKDRSDRPALVVCTKESIANALLDMVVQGLSPMKKQCYFIVYGNKLTLQRSYLGTLAIAKRVGGVLTAVANCVYEGDEFIFLWILKPDSKRLSSMSRHWKLWMQTRSKVLMLFLSRMMDVLSLK